MPYIIETIEVMTKYELLIAVNSKYQKILVIGELYDEVKKSLNGKLNKLSAISGITFLAGLIFWPLLIAGGIGMFLSEDEFKKCFKKYDVKVNESNITLTLKKKYCK